MNQQLRQLGFHTDSTDFAVDAIEGVVLHSTGKNWLWFIFKSLTNSFTPGLFQYVCSSCATMGHGTVYLECDAGAHAGLLAAIGSSELSNYITDKLPPTITAQNTIIYELVINYQL